MAKECPICRAQYTDDKDFCDQDGAPLSVATPTAPPSAGSGQVASTASPVPVAATLVTAVAPPPAAPPALAPPPSTPIPVSAAVAPAAVQSPQVSGSSLSLKRAGIEAGFLYKLGQDVIIGKFDPDVGPVDVDLSKLDEAEYISRQHARIYRNKDEWFVQDLSSANGVWLKRKRIQQPEKIQDGDEVALGNALFIFRST